MQISPGLEYSMHRGEAERGARPCGRAL